MSFPRKRESSRGDTMERRREPATRRERDTCFFEHAHRSRESARRILQTAGTCDPFGPLSKLARWTQQPMVLACAARPERAWKFEGLGPRPCRPEPLIAGSDKWHIPSVGELKSELWGHVGTQRAKPSSWLRNTSARIDPASSSQTWRLASEYHWTIFGNWRKTRRATSPRGPRAPPPPVMPRLEPGMTGGVVDDHARMSALDARVKCVHDENENAALASARRRRTKLAADFPCARKVAAQRGAISLLIASQ